MSGAVPPIWPNTAYVRPLSLMDGGRRAATHRATLRPPGQRDTVRGYVKHFFPNAPRGLVNEVIGWSINRLLGVPQAPAALMPAPTWGGLTEALAFVSLEARPTFEGRACELYDITVPAQRAALTARLRQCNNLPLLVAADQLHANGDRHLGNLGFTGKHSFAVFDQSDILGGCDWSPHHLLKPTPWAHHHLIGDAGPNATMLPFALLDSGLKSQLVNAVQLALRRFYEGQAGLREALMTGHNDDTRLGMDAIFWRSLTLEAQFRQRLNLLL